MCDLIEYANEIRMRDEAMSETRHTPEPWINPYPGSEVYLRDIVNVTGHYEDGRPMYWTVATVNQRRDESEANANRIVACVNALQGLTNDEVARLPELWAALREYGHADPMRNAIPLIGDIARAARACGIVKDEPCSK